MRRSILVVAAHPDDEVLGCGATMARHVASGDNVRVLILGQGIASRKGVPAGKTTRLIAKLREEGRKANAVLGVKEVLFRDLPDNTFDSVPLLRVVREIEAVVERFKPDTVYTHHSGDLNVDHRIAAEAVVTACRPLAGCPVREILAFEVPSSTEWRFAKGKGFEPTVFLEASRFLEAKVRAMAAYQSEALPFPHPRSGKYLRSLAAVRGGQSGLAAAEAFILIRRLDP
ncbi:MAG: PIG-L family deacetylase [Elusimicrobiota bacterium]|jgi:LmbE family N-acetylglucosaminyl deacetylase